MLNKTTVAFCGFGRAGKDTAGSIFGKITPLRYTGSISWHAKGVMAELLGVCEQEAWETRHANREFWKRSMDEIREKDPAMFIRSALCAGEIVCGVRDKVELDSAKAEGILSYSIWVDRKVPVDPTVTYGPDSCDFVLDNNGDLVDLKHALVYLAIKIGVEPRI